MSSKRLACGTMMVIPLGQRGHGLECASADINNRMPREEAGAIFDVIRKIGEVLFSFCHGTTTYFK